MKCVSACRLSNRALRGHPFMTSTRRGRGGQAQVDACGQGGGGQALCGRPHRKLKLESADSTGSHVFFSCKEVGVSIFTRISSLDGIKCGNFSAI